MNVRWQLAAYLALAICGCGSTRYVPEQANVVEAVLPGSKRAESIYIWSVTPTGTADFLVEFYPSEFEMPRTQTGIHSPRHVLASQLEVVAVRRKRSTRDGPHH